MIINANDSFTEIQQLTRQLPSTTKMELIRALLSEIRPDTTKNTKPDTDSLILTGLTDGELHTLTKIMLPDVQQERLNQLLQKNCASKLSEDKNQEIDDLLAEVQRISLIKAKAIYTLTKVMIQPTCIP